MQADIRDQAGGKIGDFEVGAAESDRATMDTYDRPQRVVTRWSHQPPGRSGSNWRCRPATDVHLRELSVPKRTYAASGNPPQLQMELPEQAGSHFSPLYTPKVSSQCASPCCRSERLLWRGLTVSKRVETTRSASRCSRPRAAICGPPSTIMR